MTTSTISPLLTISGTTIAVGAIIYLWIWSTRGVDSPQARSETATRNRFTRNAITPLISSGFDRLIFWAFWIVALRILGPERNGEYAFATNLLTYFVATVDFGLSTILTRDIARRNTDLRPLFGAALTIRLRLVAVSMPVMIGLAIIYWATGSISTLTLATVTILAIGLLPTAIGQAFASIYGAWERMDRRAIVSAGTSALTVGLGLLLLGLGAGVLGLAIAGVMSGIASLFTLGRPIGFHLLRASQHTRTPTRPLLLAGLPLMLNGLLATIFIQADVLILQPLHGTVVVGHYNAAFKFINALNSIPAALVLAAFPLMARAAHDPDDLARWVTRVWRILASLAAPAVVLIFAHAESVVGTLLGNQFLPFTANALAILIWFLPMSYLNGTLQYVVIARDRQWWLTPAFLITTAFNIGTNMALVPTFGFQAAAATTIASEDVLLTMLVWLLRGESWLPRIVEPAARPFAASVTLAVVTWLLRDLSWLLAATIGLTTYATVLIATGGISRSVFDVVKVITNRWPSNEPNN